MYKMGKFCYLIRTIVIFISFRVAWCFFGGLLLVPSIFLDKTICYATYNKWVADECWKIEKGLYPTEENRICWVNKENCEIYFDPPLSPPRFFYIFDFVSLLLMFVNLPWFGGIDYFGKVIIEKRIYKDNEEIIIRNVRLE